MKSATSEASTEIALASPPAAPAAAVALPRGVLFALTAVWLIWSSTYLALHIAVESMPPFWAAGARYIVAGAIILAVAVARGERIPGWRSWVQAGVVGLLLCVVGNGFIAYASLELPSGVIAIVAGTMPLWGALWGRFLGAPFSPRELVGLGVGLAAVVLLSSGGDLHGSPVTVGLLFLAPIGWSLGSILVRRFDLGGPLGGTAAQMLVGGAGLLVVSALRGDGLWPSDPQPEAWIAFAYLIGAGSLVGFVSYQYLLRNARPAVAMSYAYVNPVLAVVLGAVLGGEAISARGLGALGLISLAVLVIVTRPRVGAPARS